MIARGASFRVRIAAAVLLLLMGGFFLYERQQQQRAQQELEDDSDPEATNESVDGGRLARGSSAVQGTADRKRQCELRQQVKLDDNKELFFWYPRQVRFKSTWFKTFVAGQCRWSRLPSSVKPDHVVDYALGSDNKQLAVAISPTIHVRKLMGRDDAAMYDALTYSQLPDRNGMASYYIPTFNSPYRTMSFGGNKVLGRPAARGGGGGLSCAWRGKYSRACLFGMTRVPTDCAVS